MRLCAIKHVEEGMILSKSIYNADGRLLLSAGYRLSHTIKSKLKVRGYNHVYIEEEGTDNVVPQDIISDQIRLQASLKLADKTVEIREITKFENMNRDKAVKLLKEGYFKKFKINNDFKNIVDEIIKDIS